MKRLCTFILVLSLVSPLWAQEKKPARYIRYADLYDRSNYPFWRRGANLSDLLFTAVSKNQLPLLYFDSFDKEPKPFSYKQLDEKLIMPSPAWDKNEGYYQGDVVEFQGSYYSALKDNLEQEPPGNEYWYKIQPRYFDFSYLNIVGFDYQSTRAGISLTYLHFYKPDNTYMASIQAKQAIDVLNASDALWYKEKDRPFNHLVGDVFLFDEWDQEKLIADLLSISDTLSYPLQVKKEQSEMWIKFKRFKMESFYLFDYMEEFMDNLPGVNLYQHLSNDEANWMLLGDALLDTAHIDFSTNYSMTIHKPLKKTPPQVIASQRKIERVSYRNAMRFKFSPQVEMDVLDKEFANTMTKLIETIYQGLADSTLQLFPSPDLEKSYTSKEIVRQLTEQMALQYQPWSAEDTYYQGDLISYNGKNYESFTDENKNVRPDAGASWGVVSNRNYLFQPRQVASLNIYYESIFNEEGAMLKRKPLSILLYVFDGMVQAYRPIGYIQFDQLLALLNSNVRLTKFCTSLVEQEFGLFGISETGPLKVVKSN